jgi:hypothetical protein
VVRIDPSPASLISQGIEKGIDVDQLDKLLALKERYDKEEARKAFFAARAKFQSLCPPITKDKTVEFGNTKYAHATLSHIAETIKASLSECGLTYRWEIDEEGGPRDPIILMTFILTHFDGHGESTTLSALMDDSGSKNQIQQKGSTVTYLQRYTMIAGLGLSTALEDDDGAQNSATNIEKILKHNETVRDCFEIIGAIKSALHEQEWDRAIESYDELTPPEVRALWLAPTKGGIFTETEYREMKSDEWAEARNQRPKENEDG